MKAVEVVRRSVLPVSLVGSTLLIIPLFIVVSSIVNPHLLYPSVKAIQPWQWESAGLVCALAVALYFVGERKG